MYRYHTECRACGNALSESIADFGPTPMANDFADIKQEHKGFAPLELLFCERCSLAQLSVTVDPEVLYLNYPYVTSKSEMMTRHISGLLHDLKELAGGELGRVLEIGCNDATLLKMAKPMAKSITGIDIAVNHLDPFWDDEKCSFIKSLFDHSSASVAGIADVVIARHVFAHIDDWQKFITDLDYVTSASSLVAIEVPYAADMLSGLEWDTVYHEHLSYVSVRSVNELLKDSRWKVWKTKRYDIHGGSIVFFLRRREWNCEEVPNDLITFDDYRLSLQKWRTQANVTWSELIRGPKNRIFGYGAPAKATFWVKHLSLSHRDLEFIHDETKSKQGRLLPGTKIPVLDGRERMKDCDVGFLFAWNYAEEILRNEKWFTDLGKRLVVPIRPEKR